MPARVAGSLFPRIAPHPGTVFLAGGLGTVMASGLRRDRDS